jgi:tetratricopeptide (TPR) repeat protein
VIANLKYRKFDTAYVRAFQGAAFKTNDLPIVTLASDRLTFPAPAEQNGQESSHLPSIAEWERWNDYGIGLLRKPARGLLRHAESAFLRVAELGRGEGSLNLARVFIREGRLEEATAALRDASMAGAYPWSVTWFGGLVDMQNGELDAAIGAFRALVETRFSEARRRGFDFSRDYRLHNTLAKALFERSKLARDADETSRWLQSAIEHFNSALELDPENVSAHYGLSLAYMRLGKNEQATHHLHLHDTYRRDDNAHDRAVALARSRDAAASHASQTVVIYDVQRGQEWQAGLAP